MFKNGLLLFGFVFTLIACHPPEFEVYSQSIVNSSANEARNVDLNELLLSFIEHGKYRYSERDLKGSEDGSLSYDPRGLVELIPDDSAVNKKIHINGAFTIRDAHGYKRLLVEVRLNLHWSMAPRYTLMEVFILKDRNLVLVPLKIDTKLALQEREMDIYRKTFQPIPFFGEEIRVFEIQNEKGNPRMLLGAMVPTVYNATKIFPKRPEEKRAIDQFVEKYDIRTYESSCDFLLTDYPAYVRRPQKAGLAN